MKATTPNPILREAIMEVVENQLRDDDPPETRQTYQRLRRNGYGKQEAMRLIGLVVASEFFSIMNEGKPFDQQRFVSRLAQLPRAPWMDEEA